MGIFETRPMYFENEGKADGYIKESIHPEGCRCNDHTAHSILGSRKYFDKEEGKWAVRLAVQD